MVLFPYTAQNEDELSLKEGQLITIITKDCEDEGWWKGEIEGKVGLFPINFVERVSQDTSEEVKGRISGELSASKYFIKKFLLNNLPLLTLKFLINYFI